MSSAARAAGVLIAMSSPITTTIDDEVCLSIGAKAGSTVDLRAIPNSRATDDAIDSSAGSSYITILVSLFVGELSTSPEPKRVWLTNVAAPSTVDASTKATSCVDGPFHEVGDVSATF